MGRDERPIKDFENETPGRKVRRRRSFDRAAFPIFTSSPAFGADGGFTKEEASRH